MVNKKDLLGSVTKLKNTSDHSADFKNLKAEFKHANSAIRSFCTGCGTMPEHTLSGANFLADTAGADLPQNLKRYYIECDSCPFCSGSIKNFQLKKISD